jgi:ATP-dependent RNA helicase RhlE
MSFASLGLIDQIAHPRLARLQAPTAVQSQAIPAVLAGRDVMAAAQTGTGKTAGFALPLLQRLVMDGMQVASNSVRALVLVPTRELAEQVHESVAGLRRRPAAAHHGGLRRRQHQSADDAPAQGRRPAGGHARPPARPAAPERGALQPGADAGAGRSRPHARPRLFARIDQVLAAAQARQTLLFSATFSDPIRALAGKLLRDPVSIEPARATRPSRRSASGCPGRQEAQARAVPAPAEAPRLEPGAGLRQDPQGRRPAGRTAGGERHRADSIHGDKPQPARLRALERFKAGECRCWWPPTSPRAASTSTTCRWW